jgi:hypothetical protein
VETSSTKVVCEQTSADILVEELEPSSFVIQDEIRSPIIDVTPNDTEMRDLKVKQGAEVLVEEEEEEYDNFKSPVIQNLSKKLGSTVLIEEPTSDTDLDEHEIARSNYLSVSRGVSIVSLTSDDEGSLKGSISKDLSAEEAFLCNGSSLQFPLTDNMAQKELEKGEVLHVASHGFQNERLKIKSTTEEEKPQKGKLVEKASASKIINCFKEAQLTSPTSEAEKNLKLDVCTREEFSPVTQKPKILLGEQIHETAHQRGQRTGDENGNDPEIEALLQRIQKQRSVLEEILEKEEERKCEGKE